MNKKTKFVIRNLRIVQEIPILFYYIPVNFWWKGAFTMAFYIFHEAKVIERT